ncbi:MAG: universal stress protein [Desulfobacteraceae bacterium]|nr:MAG: universal stress protein [Desulfobacteraceae bacterium]
MAETHKILIAVDGSESSMDAVEYVSSFHDPLKTAITLIHVMADLPEALEDLKHFETTGALDIASDQCHSRMTENVERMMISAEKRLTESGYDQKAIEIKILKRSAGVAKDIISESEKGYDAIFIGRRGAGNPKDIIVGATAYRMMSGIQHLPVVVVGDKPDPKHVLIGFDGSENAFKAVDCACSLMPKHGRKVMLCHVAQRMTSLPGEKKVLSDDQEKALAAQSRQQIRERMQEAANRLMAAGFDPDLIVQELLEGKVSRAVAIAKTAEIEGYGTIVTGRRGLSVIKDFLMGRVSMKVLHRAHEMAVWIV